MKAIIFAVILLVAFLATYPFLKQAEHANPLTGLPWQIDVLADGTTKVFGINIGNSRLSDAVKHLGDDMEIAIIAATDEVGKLEMYFRSYRVGLLSGKIILSTNTSEQNIKNWRDNAIKTDYVATGRAKKYFLSEEDRVIALEEVITGITFIPSVNLDDEVIQARFGVPDSSETIDGIIHYKYFTRGLSIAYSENAKEVLQYVVPTSSR